MDTLKAGQKVRVNKNYGPAIKEANDGSMEAMQGQEGIVVKHDGYYVEVRVGRMGEKSKGHWLFEPRELDLV